MPTPPLDEPIHKVTLNLWESDYRAMIQSYGPGWSSRIRELVREHVKTKLTFARGATSNG